MRFAPGEVSRLVEVARATARAPRGAALMALVRAVPGAVPAAAAVACRLEGRDARLLCACPSGKLARALARRVARLSPREGRLLRRSGREGPLVAVACRLDARALLVLALGRRPKEPPFSVREGALLRAVRPLLVGAAGRIEGALDALTPREAEVARAAARGLGDREIARSLEIGFATVRTHLQRAFAKLGISGRTELAWLAVHGALAPISRERRRPGGRRRGRRRARGR